MRTVTLPLPALGFVIATRAALAVGIGLLVSRTLSASRRQAVGAALVTFGIASTLPAVMLIRRGLRQSASGPVYTDPQLRGVTRFPRKGDDEV